MDPYFPKKLRKIYESGTNKGLLTKDGNQSNDNFQQQLNSLSKLGLINVVQLYLGAAQVELTTEGIKFCKQINNVAE